MTDNVIKGPFDGPGPPTPPEPPETLDVAATFLDLEFDPFMVMDYGPDGEIMIDCSEFDYMLLNPEILEFLQDFAWEAAQRFEDGYYDEEEDDG